MNCSVTPYNYQDVPEILAYARRQELQVQSSAYMFPPLRRDETKVGINDRFTPEEAARQQAQLAYLQRGKEWFAHHIEALEAGQGVSRMVMKIARKRGNQCIAVPGKVRFG
ncbi:MAG: hypothetical protein LUH07_03785 [Lachnospiraceae bacterium]|nr:hypothetical protein [Lachnospiraceae bacterium]